MKDRSRAVSINKHLKYFFEILQNTLWFNKFYKKTHYKINLIDLMFING